MCKSLYERAINKEIKTCYVDLLETVTLIVIRGFFWGGGMWGHILFISTNKKDSIKALRNMEGDK